MAVDGGTPGLGTDFVELIAEQRHVGGLVFIAGDDLVDGVDDDGVKVLIAHTAHELGHQLVQRHSLAAQVPQHDVCGVGLLNVQGFVDFGKAVDAAGAVDLQIHIQHAALLAGKAQPLAALGNRNRQLHEQKRLARLRGAGDEHLVPAAEYAADQLLRQLRLVCQQR